MGRFSELAIEIEEQELDFELRDCDDLTWWQEQDAEMVQSEMDQLEADAELHAQRQGGWL